MVNCYKKILLIMFFAKTFLQIFIKHKKYKINHLDKLYRCNNSSLFMG